MNRPLSVFEHYYLVGGGKGRGRWPQIKDALASVQIFVQIMNYKWDFKNYHPDPTGHCGGQRPRWKSRLLLHAWLWGFKASTCCQVCLIFLLHCVMEHFRGITTGQGMCDLMLEEAKVIMKGNRQLGQKWQQKIQILTHSHRLPWCHPPHFWCHQQI